MGNWSFVYPGDRSVAYLVVVKLVPLSSGHEVDSLKFWELRRPYEATTRQITVVSSSQTYLWTTIYSKHRPADQHGATCSLQSAVVDERSYHTEFHTLFLFLY